MNAAWATVLVVGAGTAALKAVGPVAVGGRRVPPRLFGVLSMLAPALLAALVVVEGFAAGKSLVLDARLAGLAAIGFALPLWVIPFLPPAPVVFTALFLATLCAPLINGPIIAVLTARTPGELRAKVMTAVISVNTVAAPLGFLVAGQVLDRWGVAPLFAGIAVGITVMAGVFATIVLRHREPDGARDVSATAQPQVP